MGEKSEAEMEINFSALKKHDESIQHIIDTASSVAHYRFNSTSGFWEKTDVEGSLFLYSRKTSPYVIIFIMNRLNKDNAKLTLSPEMEFKVQEPFILCKSSNSEIIGIWFYDCGECHRFGLLLSRFHALSKDEKSLQISIMMEAQKRNISSISPPNGLMGMFSQAQDEYTKSRLKFAQEQKQGGKGNANQKKESAKPKKVQLHRGTSEPGMKLDLKTKTPLHLESKTPSPGDKEEQEGFVEDSHKGDVIYNFIHGKSKPHHGHSTSTEFELGNPSPLRNDLFSAAGDLATFNNVMSDQTFLSNHHVKQKAIDCAELESQICKPIKAIETDECGSTYSSSNHSKTARYSYNGETTAYTSSFSLQPLDILNNSRTLINSSNINMEATVPLVSSSSSASMTSLTNHLLSPHVMISGKGRGTTLSNIASNQQNFSLAANFNKQGIKACKKADIEKVENKTTFPEAPSGSALKSLMAPAAFLLTSPNTGKSEAVNKPPEKITEITKKEFQSALLSMIQNDNEFVTKLYETFLNRLPQN